MQKDRIRRKKDLFAEIVDRTRLRIQDKKYLDEKWLRATDDLFRWYSKEYLYLKIRQNSSVYDLGTGPGYFLWFLRELSGCDVYGMDCKSDREDYHVLWQELGLIGRIGFGRIEPFCPIFIPARYDYIIATGICFDQNSDSVRWGEEEWLYFIKDTVAHLKDKGELYLKFNVIPQGKAFALFKDIGSWIKGNTRVRIKRQNLLERGII